MTSTSQLRFDRLTFKRCSLHKSERLNCPDMLFTAPRRCDYVVRQGQWMGEETRPWWSMIVPRNAKVDGLNWLETVGHVQRSMRSEGSLLFMTFSRMAAFASSSVVVVGVRCTGAGLRNAFQAKWRAGRCATLRKGSINAVGEKGRKIIARKC